MTTETLTPEQAVAWIEAQNASRPDDIRDLANELIRTGGVNKNTTFADAKVILQQHYAPSAAAPQQ